MTSQTYLPFRGLSGWFSCSISPALAQLWDSYGGTLAGEDEASYLFSDDATAKDTIRVYETQQDVAVFQSSWIHEVILHRCSVHDVPLGQHLLLPHYLVGPREHGSPQPANSTLLRQPTEYHGVLLTNAENKWKNSRESQHQHQLHHQSNNLKLHSTTNATTSSNADTGNANTGNAIGVYSLSESASVMFAEYNATWDELESRLRSTNLKDIADTVQVPHVANASLIDFNTSQPEFKIRRV